MRLYNLIDESGCIVVEGIELSLDEVIMVESSGLIARDIES